MTYLLEIKKNQKGTIPVCRRNRQPSPWATWVDTLWMSGQPCSHMQGNSSAFLQRTVPTLLPVRVPYASSVTVASGAEDAPAFPGLKPFPWNLCTTDAVLLGVSGRNDPRRYQAMVLIISWRDTCEISSVCLLARARCRRKGEGGGGRSPVMFVTYDLW